MDDLAVETMRGLDFPFLIARKSAVFLALRLGLIEGLFLALIGLVLIPFSSVGDPATRGTLFSGFVIYLVMGVVAIKVVTSFLACLYWLRESYEIRPHEVIYRRGLIGKKEVIFSCRNVQELEVHQTMFGKLFNFGTVSLYNPVLRERFFLRDIAAPNEHCQIVERLITGPTPKPDEAVLVPMKDRG